MNAGLDAAIGDYVYEFDSTELCYAPPLIMQAYRAALDGSDIVSVCPRTVRGGSSLFIRCSRPLPERLPPAHRCVPSGDAPRHQPRPCVQHAPALPQGGLRGQRLTDGRSGI